MPKKTISLMSWNVNGIRAAERKGFLQWLQKAKPDILGVQETKAQVEQLGDEILRPKGYETFWSSANRKGYSGTAVYVKKSPLMSITNFHEDWLDEEGRVIMIEYPDFLFFNVYFPNGQRGDERLQYKLDFYDKFIEYIQAYRKKGKNIIVVGDYNTAHYAIDLSRPKENVNTSGFMPIERAQLDRLQKLGYVDTFRQLHPEQIGAYSYWNQMTRARERNAGWRIDYVWLNKELLHQVKSAFILPDVIGSDHCPVGITLESTLDR